MPDTARTPLLNAHRSSGYEPSSSEPGAFIKELWYLFKTTLPIIAAYALQNSIQTATVVIVGRLGPDELSAAAFTMMLATVTGWCIALGGTTALDTFGSQSYTYSGRNPAAILPHLFRCMIILWGLLIPVLVLWFFAAPILLLLGQSERLCYDVQSFLRVLILGAPAYVGFESVKKYLQCQGIMHASTLVLMITSPFNVLLSFLLVHRTRLAFMGAPIAISITYHLSFLLLIVYAKWGPGPPEDDDHPALKTPSISSVGVDHESQPRSPPATEANTIHSSSLQKSDGSSPLALRNLLAPAHVIAFLRLALPGILMVATEWWAFEIVALAAGRLGRISLAAQSVVMTADLVLTTVEFGISVSTSTRIGNLIGARRAKHAKLCAHTATFFGVCAGSLVMAILLVERNAFGYLFSDDDEVAQLVAHIMPLVASFQVADTLSGACGGVLRGQGRQHIGAKFNIVSYYFFALPLGLALAFKVGLGLTGLWIGQLVALFVIGVGEYIVVWRFTDWDEEVRLGVERVST